MERAGGPLRDLLQRLRLSEPIRGWEAVSVWPEVVGPRVAERARAVAFRDGELVVEVDSAAWMSELTYLKRKILKDLNDRLADRPVRDLRLKPAGERPGPPVRSEGIPENEDP